MVQRQTFHFVQWQQNLHKELLVFRLQGQGKAIDNAEITRIQNFIDAAALKQNTAKGTNF